MADEIAGVEVSVKHDLKERAKFAREYLDEIGLSPLTKAAELFSRLEAEEAMLSAEEEPKNTKKGRVDFQGKNRKLVRDQMIRVIDTLMPYYVPSLKSVDIIGHANPTTIVFEAGGLPVTPGANAQRPIEIEPSSPGEGFETDAAGDSVSRTRFC